MTNREVLYIVVGQNRLRINNRVEMILSLSDFFNQITLVCSSKREKVNEHSTEYLPIKAYPNPTGIFRLLKQNGLKKKIDQLIYFPSTKILYIKKAQKVLLPFVKKDISKGYHVNVITCAPPHDICILGLFLKKNCPEINWLIDWQDLWSYDDNYLQRIPKIYKRRLYNVENEIFNYCDINITTNNNAKKVIENHYNVPSYKVVTINHHFCRRDFKSSEFDDDAIFYTKNAGSIKIGFLGTLFKPPRVPGLKIVETIDSLRKAGIKAELHVYGMVDKAIRKRIFPKHKDSIILNGIYSHHESLQRVSKCDYLLVLLEDLPNCYAVMSIKLSHYLLLNKPILGIVPENSAIAKIIRKTGSGFVIDTDADWGYELNKILNDYGKGENLPVRNEAEIEKYSWDKISKKWLEVLSKHV